MDNYRTPLENGGALFFKAPQAGPCSDFDIDENFMNLLPGGQFEKKPKDAEKNMSNLSVADFDFATDLEDEVNQPLAAPQKIRSDSKPLSEAEMAPMLSFLDGLDRDDDGDELSLFGDNNVNSHVSAPQAASGAGTERIQPEDLLTCPTCFIPAVDNRPDDTVGIPYIINSRNNSQGAISSSGPAFVDGMPVEGPFGRGLQLPSSDLQVAGVSAQSAQPEASEQKHKRSSPDQHDDDNNDGDDDEDYDEEDSAPKTRHSAKHSKTKDDKKMKRNLPSEAVLKLKAWLLSEEHFDHPYPTEEEKEALAQECSITQKQLTNWFTNARKRIWTPLRKAQGRAVLDYQTAKALLEQKKVQSIKADVLPSALLRQAVQDHKRTPKPTDAQVEGYFQDVGLHALCTGNHVALSSRDAAALGERVDVVRGDIATERRQLLLRLEALEMQEQALEVATHRIAERTDDSISFPLRPPAHNQSSAHVPADQSHNLGRQPGMAGRHMTQQQPLQAPMRSMQSQMMQPLYDPTPDYRQVGHNHGGAYYGGMPQGMDMGEDREFSWPPSI